MPSVLTSWMYVSRSANPEYVDICVEDIVAVSTSRNALLNVTGALLATPLYFAQYLEGPKFGIEQLKASIARDERHSDIAVLQDGPATARRFAGWHLAYADPSVFLEQAMAEPLREASLGSGLAVRRLMCVMTEFVGVGAQQ